MKFSKLFLIPLFLFLSLQSSELSDPHLASGPPAPRRLYPDCATGNCGRCHACAENKEKNEAEQKKDVTIEFHYKDITFNDTYHDPDCCYFMNIFKCHCPDLRGCGPFSIPFEKNGLTVQNVYKAVRERIGNNNIEIRIGRFMPITDDNLTKYTSFEVRLKERCCCCDNCYGIACCKS